MRTEADLTDAIAYFVSGDDDHSSLYSRSGINIPPSKITLRLDVVVEYDGPSLSDTSSIASFPTSDGSSFVSRRSGLTSDSRLSDPYTTHSGSHGYRADPNRLSDYSLTSYGDPRYYAASRRSSATSGTQRRPAIDRELASVTDSFESAVLDDGASGLTASTTPNFTQSELGSRWLREQSQIAQRMPRLRLRRREFDDGDADPDASDEEIGDISLVRDARGRECETSSAHTVSLADKQDTTTRTRTRRASSTAQASRACRRPRHRNRKATRVLQR